MKRLPSHTAIHHTWRTRMPTQGKNWHISGHNERPSEISDLIDENFIQEFLFLAIQQSLGEANILPGRDFHSRTPNCKECSISISRATLYKTGPELVPLKG